MLNKIRQYVNYQLRFDHSKDIEEKKEEIIANITDRYEEILKDTHDRQYAYIEAIKSMGNFTSSSTESEETYKPKVAEMFLLSGLILAIFSLLLIMFEPLVGGVIVMMSIIFFSTGAIYLYQESQYTKNKEYDIDKHNVYLKKVFAYIKSCFVFWSISISLLITILLNQLITTLIILNTVNNVFSFDDFLAVLILSAIIFVVIFVILMFIFRAIYLRLTHQYNKMTGEDTIDSIGSKAKNFLFDDTKNDNIRVISRIYPIYVLIFSLLYLLSLIIMIFTLRDREIVYPFVITVQFLIVIINILIAVLGLKGFIRKKYLIALTFLLSSIILIGLVNIQFSSIGPTALIGGSILIILLIIDLISHLKRTKK